MPKTTAGYAKQRGIYEREKGSGVWWIRYTDSDGMLHREKGGTHSDAETLLRKKKTDVLRKKKLPELTTVKVTFDSLCDDALEYCAVNNTAKVTHDFKLKLVRLRAEFGSRAATKITKKQITDWLNEEARAKGWKPATRNRWQAAFSLIYRVGIEENERIDTNPASGIKRKKEKNAVDRYLFTEEEQALRKVILDRFPEFLPQLDISLHTGMRASEQFKMEWHQVNFERKMLTLYETKNGDPRYIPLNATALAAFAELKKRNPQGRVFPSARREGEGLQGARGWFKTALTAAGITRYTWHCNRHTFASRLVMAGVDIHTVGKLLGHRSLEMTKRYAHLSPEHNASAVAKLDSVKIPD